MIEHQICTTETRQNGRSPETPTRTFRERRTSGCGRVDIPPGTVDDGLTHLTQATCTAAVLVYHKCNLSQ